MIIAETKGMKDSKRFRLTQSITKLPPIVWRKFPVTISRSQHACSIAALPSSFCNNDHICSHPVRDMVSINTGH